MKLTLFEHPGGDRPLAALGLLLMGVFVLALQDSLVKLMSTDTSFWQFQTLRSIGNLSFIVILALASGSLSVVISQPGVKFLSRRPEKLSLRGIFEYRYESADQVEGNEWSSQYSCRY